MKTITFKKIVIDNVPRDKDNECVSFVDLFVLFSDIDACMPDNIHICKITENNMIYCTLLISKANILNRLIRGEDLYLQVF